MIQEKKGMVQEIFWRQAPEGHFISHLMGLGLPLDSPGKKRGYRSGLAHRDTGKFPGAPFASNLFFEKLVILNGKHGKR